MIVGFVYNENEAVYDSPQTENISIEKPTTTFQSEDAKRREIELMAQNNPLIKGLISGVITYYIEPLPAYANQDVRNSVNEFDRAINGLYLPELKMKFQRTNDSNNPDISFQWIKNYGTHVAGEAIFKRVLKIGLGNEQCGEWQPFDSQSVILIMVHEFGHALGYHHSNDPNNVMYATTDYRLSVDYDKIVTLDEGQLLTIPFCRGGTFSYSTTSSSQSNGFEIYVLTPETNSVSFLQDKIGQYYPSCSGEESKAYSSFSNKCTVPMGSKLLIYNKNDILQFSAIDVKVRIIDENIRSMPNLEWDYNAFEYDQAFLDEVWNMYH